MTNLIEKIDRSIEKAAMNSGRMGTETVTATLLLTDREHEQFYEIKKYDSPDYFWEFDGNELTIGYTEDF